jgi:dTDP-4-amino-4,6-dideoxygalactose transaminase
MIKRTANDPLLFTRRLAFTSSARVAWRLLLERVKFPAGTSVLLPAYIGISEREGSGIFDPIEVTRTPYALYPLDGNLRPDLRNLQAKLETGLHPLLLIVHYFGVVNVDLFNMRKLCDRYRTLLIEDCAHIPWPIYNHTGVGSQGHAAFYSMHKSIAVPTGGILRLNTLDFELPVPEGVDRCDENCLVQFLRTDMEAIADKRRDNYRWLAKRLEKAEGVSVLYPEIGELVPHDFPIFVHGGLREKLYFELMKENLPTVALYYRLIDAISPADYPKSHMLSKSILNLPVHQDTEFSDLEHLSDRLMSILGRLRR